MPEDKREQVNAMVELACPKCGKQPVISEVADKVNRGTQVLACADCGCTGPLQGWVRLKSLALQKWPGPNHQEA